MELVKTYEEYNELNKEYVKYIQMVMESDISNHDNIIMNNLENYSNLFEDLKLRCDKIEVEEKDINNLRDLNYLALDTLFLTMDLKNFYKLGEIEPMLFINYAKTYDNFLRMVDKDYKITFSLKEEQILAFISALIIDGKRPHELLMLKMMIEDRIINEYSFKNDI